MAGAAHSCADDDVVLFALAVLGGDAVLGDGRDVAEDRLDVVLAQGLEEANAGREPTATDRLHKQRSVRSCEHDQIQCEM